MQPMRFIMILLVCHLSNATWAQVQSNVKGLVTDSSGEPLIGVSILVKSTNNGTVSDLDGKFTVTAKTGDILHISYVGYISQEIKAEENKQLRIRRYEEAGRSCNRRLWYTKEGESDRICIFHIGRRLSQQTCDEYCTSIGRFSTGTECFTNFRSSGNRSNGQNTWYRYLLQCRNRSVSID